MRLEDALAADLVDEGTVSIDTDDICENVEDIEPGELEIAEERWFDDKALVEVMPDDDFEIADDRIFREERATVVATDALKARDAEPPFVLAEDRRETCATEEAAEEITGDAVREEKINDADAETERYLEAVELAGEESVDKEADDNTLDRLLDTKCTELPAIEAEETIAADDISLENAIEVEDANVDTRVMLRPTDDGNEDAECPERPEEAGTEATEEGGAVADTVENIEALKDWTEAFDDGGRDGVKEAAEETFDRAEERVEETRKDFEDCADDVAEDETETIEEA